MDIFCKKNIFGRGVEGNVIGVGMKGLMANLCHAMPLVTHLKIFAKNCFSQIDKNLFWDTKDILQQKMHYKKSKKTLTCNKNDTN